MGSDFQKTFLLKGNLHPLLPKNHFKPQDVVFTITLALIFFQNSVYSGGKRIFLFSNFLGPAIFNNCDVSWLLYCSYTKIFCLLTKGQPFHVTIIQDGGARELKNKNKRFYNRPFYSCVRSYLAMNASEAGVDLALIQTSLLFSCKCKLVSITAT